MIGGNGILDSDAFYSLPVFTLSKKFNFDDASGINPVMEGIMVQNNGLLKMCGFGLKDALNLKARNYF